MRGHRRTSRTRTISLIGMFADGDYDLVKKRKWKYLTVFQLSIDGSVVHSERKDRRRSGNTILRSG